MYLGKHRGSFKSYSAEKLDILVMPRQRQLSAMSVLQSFFVPYRILPSGDLSLYAPDSSGAFLVTVKVVLW